MAAGRPLPQTNRPRGEHERSWDHAVRQRPSGSELRLANATPARNRRSMNMQTRILLLAGLLAAAGCAEHRVATAPPASAPAPAAATAQAAATTTSATTAMATTASAPSRPVPQAQPEPRFYTPSNQQSPTPVSVQGSQPVQAAQPVHALGQPGGQANPPSRNAYNTPPQGYTASGLNSDPSNPSGAPGYSPWH